MAKYRFDEIAVNCTEKRMPDEEDRLNYIGLEHLDTGCLHINRWGSKVPLKGEKLIMHKGDVLLGKRNAYLRRAAICPHDGIFSAHGMVLQPQENVIDKSFFPLFVSSDYFFDEVIRISVGSLSPTVNWKDLRELEFELPNMKDQRKLARVLWAINDTIEAYKNLITTTDQLVKSQFIEMFGNPVTNEKHWITQKMSKVAPSHVKSTPRANSEGKYWLLNLDMVESNSGKIIKKNMVAQDQIGMSTTEFGPENVLYSKLRPYLNKVVIPDETGYVTTEMIPLLPNKRLLNSTFLTMLLRGREFLTYIESHVSGTKMPRVQMDAFWNFEVILPPLELQSQFANFVHQTDKSKLFEWMEVY